MTKNPEEGTTSPRYVALVDLPWGDGRLAAGETVPVEDGRNYHQMLMLGQIGHLKASDTVTAPDGAIAVYLHPDGHAIFVNEEGEPSEVVYLESQAPDEDARVALELSPGTLAALVKFPDDPEPSLVTQDSLLWGTAAHLLVLKVEETEAARGSLATQLEAATSTATKVAEASTGLQAQTDWLTLLVNAMQATGDTLPEDQPGVKELAANGIHSKEGVALLVAADPANLIRLKGIGQATADKIVAWLNPPAETPNATG
jgi:hypothetical protein